MTFFNLMILTLSLIVVFNRFTYNSSSTVSCETLVLSYIFTQTSSVYMYMYIMQIDVIIQKGLIIKPTIHNSCGIHRTHGSFCMNTM